MINVTKQSGRISPPDFVRNDFSLLYPGSEVLEARDESTFFEIPFNISGDKAELALWLENVPYKFISACCDWIFLNYPEVRTVEFSNFPLFENDGKSEFIERTHWKVEMPPSSAELEARLSSKKRYNIKREKRLANEFFETEFTVVNFTSETVPDEVIEKYFDFKKKTYNIDYKMKPGEYLKSYHVTDIYVLYFGDTVGAIVCSCEQYENVYLENLTYDPEYAKYSLGAILYDEYLKKLIEKKKKSVYLGYGNYSYKALYGAVSQPVFFVTVYRSKCLFLKVIKIPALKSKIKRILKRILKKIRIKK